MSKKIINVTLDVLKDHPAALEYALMVKEENDWTIEELNDWLYDQVLIGTDLVYCDDVD